MWGHSYGRRKTIDQKFDRKFAENKVFLPKKVMEFLEQQSQKYKLPPMKLLVLAMDKLCDEGRLPHDYFEPMSEYEESKYTSQAIAIYNFIKKNFNTKVSRVNLFLLRREIGIPNAQEFMEALRELDIRNVVDIFTLDNVVYYEIPRQVNVEGSSKAKRPKPVRIEVSKAQNIKPKDFDNE